MARRATGTIETHPWRDGRTVTVRARLRAYGRRYRIDFGTNHEGWSVERARVELDRILQQVERGTAAVDYLASLVPSSQRGRAANRAALDEAETALAAAEDRRDHLVASASQGGPDVRELREDWPTLTVEERREILRAAIDAVLVRRASRRTAPHPPVSERILVLFRGDAPAGLVDNGRSGAVGGWTWDGDPSTLVAAA